MTQEIPDPTFENDQNRPIGIGRGGIESVGIPDVASRHLNQDEILSIMHERLQHKMSIQSLDPETYGAIMAYLGLVEEANEPRDSAVEEGAVVIGEHQEPLMVIWSRPLYQGSLDRMYYLVATDAQESTEDFLSKIDPYVNKPHERQELAQLIGQSDKLPFDIDPILIPLDDDSDESDEADSSLLVEAGLAHVSGTRVIDDDQLRAISTVLLYHQVFGHDFGKIYVFAGEDGNKYRVYEFPQTYDKESEQ